VTKTKFSDDKKALAVFTWSACKHTKSNAIILGREYAPGCFQVIGMGAGQPNRLDSTRKLSATKATQNLELLHAELKRKDAFDKFAADQFGQFVMASDAFFPFPDNIEAANSFGIKYIMQPGGSKKDIEVIEACNTFGIAMVFTGTRHFRH
jgi:phosphoribosylaminoimidazolecarboxamide formyltransferase/IMP cyclohydrolase